MQQKAGKVQNVDWSSVALTGEAAVVVYAAWGIFTTGLTVGGSNIACGYVFNNRTESFIYQHRRLALMKLSSPKEIINSIKCHNSYVCFRVAYFPIIVVFT